MVNVAPADFKVCRYKLSGVDGSMLSLIDTINREDIKGFRNYLRNTAREIGLVGEIKRTRRSNVEAKLYGTDDQHTEFQTFLNSMIKTIIVGYDVEPLNIPIGFVHPSDVAIVKNESKFAQRGAYSDEYKDLDCNSEYSSGKTSV